MIMRINVGRYQGTVRALPALAGMIALAVLTGLGTWQLQRAAEKEQVLEQNRLSASEEAMPLDAYSAGSDLHQRVVTAAGAIDSAHQFLLDNRVRDNRVGFEVLLPLRLGGGDTAVLLNRGWVARGARRDEKPDVSPPNATSAAVRVHGIAVRPERGFQLGAMLEPGSAWPHIVQFVSVAEMEPLLGYSLLPVVVRLDADQPLALQTGWPVLTAGPERHYGYAAQWFGLALVLLLVLAGASIRRRA